MPVNYRGFAQGCVVLGLGAAAADLQAASKGPVQVWFAGTASEVSDKLALFCADSEASVIEQDERHVVCQREESGVLAQYLYGGRGSSTPLLKIRFSLLKDGESLRVQAVQWVEVETALGQSRQSFLNNRKHSEALTAHLVAIGGSETPL